jgi:hypothetical protein
MVELHISADTPEQMASMLGFLNPATMVMMEMEAPSTTKSAPSSNNPSNNPDPEASDDEAIASPKTSSDTNEPTIDDIRTALAKVNEVHDLMKAKELLNRFDVARVSDLPVEKYGTFLIAAGEVV